MTFLSGGFTDRRARHHPVLDGLYKALFAGWGSLPTDAPTVETAWNGGVKASYPSRLASEDRLTCPCPRNGTGYAYLLRPSAPIGRLVVHVTGHGNHYYHAGTGCDLMTLGLLDAGFHVLAAPMPSMSLNTALTIDVRAGSITFTAGEHRASEWNAAEADRAPCLRLFLDCVLCAIHHAIEEVAPITVDAVGLSGGGWTVDWLAAVDRRIRASVNVFGSLPFSLRPPGDVGDWEQASTRTFWDPLRHQNLLGLEESLYALGGVGVVAGAGLAAVSRRRLQILSDTDTAFPTDGIHASVTAYNEAIRRQGSDSTVLYDTTNAGEHTFTAWSVARILEAFTS